MTTAELLKTGDPTSLLYAAVVERFRVDLPDVEAGNWVTFGDAVDDPRKENRQDADLPEIMVMPATPGMVNLRADSDGFGWDERVAVTVSIGTLRTGKLFQTRWRLLLSCLGMMPQDEDAVLGLPFVPRMKVQGLSLATTSPLRREGWLDVMTLEFSMALEYDDVV